MRIVGFYHIQMINHWYDVVAEHIKLMMDSGLYEETESISVGALGEQGELKKLIKLLEAYSKFKIEVFSTNNLEYEFHTLKVLKSKCDTDKRQSFGFYLHTKGVNYPDGETPEQKKAYTGGKAWRDYMNFYNITFWRDAIMHLQHGYQVCGVKYVNKGFPNHFSGNFFWFRSEYVKDLKKIQTLNHTNRNEAEFWICSGNPLAATLCQDFVDYNSLPFIAPKDLIEQLK